MRLVSYIISNIRENSGKYIVAIIGIMFAVGSFFTLSIYSTQVQTSANQLFLLDDSVLIVTQEDAVLLNLIPTSSKLNESLQDEINEIDGIHSSIPCIFEQVEQEISTGLGIDVIFGFEHEDIEFITKVLTLDSGRWLENSDEIVIGPEALNGTYSTNDQVLIEGENLIISGVMDFDNVLYNHFIYMDYSKVQSIFSRPGECSLIYVVLDDPNNSDIIKSQIEELDNIQVLDNNDIQNLIGGINTYLEMAETVLGFIPLLVNMLFFFIIILYITRTRQSEFALLKILGISNAKLIICMLSEILLISLLGCLFGLILGYFLFTLSYQYIQDYAVDIDYDTFEYYADCITTGSFNVTFIFSTVIGKNLLITLFPFIKFLRHSLVEIKQQN